VEVDNVPLPCLAQTGAASSVVALEWHRHAEFGLLIAFQGG
jgi:WD repeat-containing protein 35